MRLDVDAVPAEIIKPFGDAKVYRVRGAGIDIETVGAIAEHAIEHQIFEILRVADHHARNFGIVLPMLTTHTMLIITRCAFAGSIGSLGNQFFWTVSQPSPGAVHST